MFAGGVGELRAVLRVGATLAVCLVLALLAGTAPATALSERDRAVYQRAFEAADRGQWTAALETAAQASDPVLRDVLLWRHMQDPASPYTFAQITDFLKSHATWPSQAALRRRADDTLTGGEAPARMIAWFTEYPPFTGRGKMLLAEALMSTGREAEAIALARSAWVNNTFNRTDERRFLGRFESHLTADHHRRRLDRLLWEGHEDSAKRMLVKVDDGHRALAQARLALMTKAPGVDGVLNRVPKELQDDPGLLYERLRWRRQADLAESAAELLAHPKANAVRPRLWWKERAALARGFLERGWITQAYAITSRHGMQSGPGFAEAEWMSGWIALRFLKDAKTALPHFERLYAGVSYPISVARAAYWAGRAQEALKADAAAKEWYVRAAEHSTTYYGQLAAARLGRTDRLHLPPAPEITPADSAAFAADSRVRAARALAAIGRPGEARPFLWRVNEDAVSPGIRRQAAELARDIGRTEMAVALARRAALRGTVLLDAGYPLLETDIPADVEPALVHALIRQESNFHATVRSSAGAIGLMQIMPATAKLVAKQVGVPHNPESLDTPAYNVRLGSAYLEDLVRRFSGSYPLALAGYNAGPGRPARWVREFGDPRRGDLDMIDWIEMIPFAETRNYVQRVMESVQVYRVRLGIPDLAFNLEQDLKR
ncbi:lytic transglycosylase domain-containing protein [Novispirillum sp. DQ9]|uniref:lytic transglycosylase domain-containing protein n=1 Tax=Novispirillum sp. DQ9 TaxID=3398612 RepID=UPI003C7DD6CA